MQSLQGQATLSSIAPAPLPLPGHQLPAPMCAPRRFDDHQYRLLLGGMLRQGHGIEALCFFLTLTRETFFEIIVRLDLPTPHDRPLRRSAGTRAWKQDNFAILLDGWFANWSAAYIGDRLGRSRGSIWYQARRLGLPKRERKALHWPTPTIVEPAPQTAPVPTRKRLPERWTVKGADRAFELTSKRNGREVDWAKNIEAYVDIAWRAFSGQRISRIAEDYGVSFGTITSQIYWLHAKTPRRHRDFVDVFDRALGQANAKAMGFQMRQCKINEIFPFFYCRGEQVARRDKRSGKHGGMDC